MTQSKTRLMAMTTLAAVLALSTPAVAQDAQPAPVNTAPVTTAPDPLGVATPVADPVVSIAPTPAPSVTTSADPLSATIAVDALAAPVAKVRTTQRRATTTATAIPVRPATRSRPAPRATIPALPTLASPAAVEPQAPIATPIVTARPAPVAATPAPVESVRNDVLPIAAAGGLGLLALLGAGAALRRRKRRAEEVEYEAFEEPQFEVLTVPAPVPVAFAEPMREPSMTRAPVMAEPLADAPAGNVPEGFDLSRFGDHVQAAYRGPTEDNPSLSLKNRLRRASAMDQMARTSDAPVEPAAPQTLSAATSTRDTGAVVSKMRPAPHAGGGFILGGEAKRRSVSPITQH